MDLPIATLLLLFPFIFVSLASGISNFPPRVVVAVVLVFLSVFVVVLVVVVVFCVLVV